MIVTMDDLLKLRVDLGESESKLTKWIFLDEKFGDEKLKCITESNLYLSFPQDFNDIFDSQMRLTDEDVDNLAVEFSAAGQPCPLVRYYQDFLSSALVSCFSSLSPLDEASHNMWGLYGVNGRGIAFSYATIDILNHYAAKGINSHRWKMLNYKDGHNPKEVLRKFIGLKRGHLIDPFSKSDEMIKLLDAFFFTKKQQWQYEQEVRVMSLDFLLDAGHHSLNMNIYGNKGQEEAHASVVSSKKAWHSQKCMPFAKPCNIFLGWEVDQESDRIKSLIRYAKNEDIPIRKLSDKFDYDKKQFISFTVS